MATVNAPKHTGFERFLLITLSVWLAAVLATSLWRVRAQAPLFSAPPRRAASATVFPDHQETEKRLDELDRWRKDVDRDRQDVKIWEARQETAQSTVESIILAMVGCVGMWIITQVLEKRKNGRARKAEE